MLEEANTSGMTRLWSLRHEFPTEWHKYVTADDENFEVTIKKEHFPYMVQGFDLEVTGFQLFVVEDKALVPLPLAETEISNTENPLEPGQKLRHTLDSLNDGTDRKGRIEIISDLLDKGKNIFLLLNYTAK